jgi:hypothetical protein
MLKNLKINDIIQNRHTGRSAEVILHSWIYMRGQPMSIYKLKYKDDGSMFTLNENTLRHWELYGEEE